jgi:ABC-2 type transport system ATP-binding protein
MKSIVQTFGLTKRFGDFTAVDHVNLEVGSEIFGLLGPNGAGKTTLTRMLTTILPPTEGTATVAGVDIVRQPHKVRERIGVVSQAMTLDVELSAYENMDIYAQYYHIPRQARRRRIHELLSVVGLADKPKVIVGSFSGGMKRRLEIVRSLVHDPELLFLDEPTTGLDPQARAAVWEHLVQLHKEEGITLVITTHYMDEAEGLCDRLAIVDHGGVVALGTPQELKRKTMGGDVVEAGFSSLPDIAFKALEKSDFVLNVKRHENAIVLLVKNGAEAVPRIVELVGAKGGRLRTIALREPTLNDVFLHFTGRELED